MLREYLKDLKYNRFETQFYVINDLPGPYFSYIIAKIQLSLLCFFNFKERNDVA